MQLFTANKNQVHGKSRVSLVYRKDFSSLHYNAGPLVILETQRKL